MLPFKTFRTYWQDILTAEAIVEGDIIKIKRYETSPFKQMFCRDEFKIYELGSILETRCWSEDRADLPEILEFLGLKEYNIYEIVKKTHGVKVSDFIWMEFDNEHLNAKKVLRREWF